MILGNLLNVLARLDIIRGANVHYKLMNMHNLNNLYDYLDAYVKRYEL